MNKRVEKNLETYQPPKWLTDVLRLSQQSAGEGGRDEEFAQANPDFVHRCREAAQIALSITKLRNERQRIGFVPLSLTDYIQDLVKLTSVSLSQVLAWFGIRELAKPGPDEVGALARLARAIGMSLRETFAHMRIGFATQAGNVPGPLLVARQRSVRSRQTPLEECELALKHIEAGYDLERLRALYNVEMELHEVYGSGDHRTSF